MSKTSDEYRIVFSSVASIYDEPNFNSQLITQALFWEQLIITDKKDNWYKIKQRDGYVGWIHSFYTTDLSVYDENEFLKKTENWYWVKKKFLSLSLSNKSKFLIPFGALVPCFDKDGKFFILLPNNKKINVDKTSLLNFKREKKYKKMVFHSAFELLDIPYLWGGRSSFGFDCSGLVQAIVNVSNVNAGNAETSFLPRDASKQISSDILIKSNNEANIGDVIFFQSENKINHVGIYINNMDFIHSSGFVKLNSIDRKSQYYSNDLEKKVYGVYKIRV